MVLLATLTKGLPSRLHKSISKLLFSVTIRDCFYSVLPIPNVMLNFNRNRDGVAKNTADIELLKKICKELEQKSQIEETKVSDMNVNIENLIMNVSLQHRETSSIIEDRKSNNH